MIQHEEQLQSIDDKQNNEFLLHAFMLEVMKYGKKGMFIKFADFKSQKLRGKVIRVDREKDSFKFTITNDPRN